jgi:Uncharacterised nucleotidyltransferase
VECASPCSTVQRVEARLRQPVDWSSLTALADDHALLPLLAARFRAVDQSVVPQAVRENLREVQRAQTVFTLGCTAELFRLLDRFTALRIETLLTKGPVLAERCYGNPGSRQYNDLDLIARSKDMQRLTEAMMALDYEPKIPLEAIRAEKFPGEYVFTHRTNKLLVEFHTEHTFRYHPLPLPVDKLFARRACVRFDGHDVPALSVEDELILICIHGAKHLWTRLMWVADVAGLVSRQNVDWHAAMSAGREVGAERMLRVGLLLAANVLGVSLPSHVNAYLHSDPAAKRVSLQIAQSLPLGDNAAFGLLGRATFRLKMRGGLLPGARYLLRLTLSPTEEDWVDGSGEKRSWLLDAIGRPFRLARKYRRDGRA